MAANISFGMDEDTEKSLNLLADTAESFLRSGGTFTLIDWRHMDNTERAAMISGSRMLEIERIVTLCKCIGNLENTLKLEAQIDGGENLIASVLQMAADRASEQIKNEHPTNIKTT